MAGRPALPLGGVAAGRAGQGRGRRPGRGGERATGGLRQETIPTTDLRMKVKLWPASAPYGILPVGAGD